MDADLAVQSFCFRGFKDNDEVARLVRECGFARIELCAVHADFSDESAFDDIVGAYTDGGVQIVSIGVERLGTDETEVRKRFEFLRRAGASFMSVDFSIGEAPQAYRVAEKLADEYDVQLGIHNHGGLHWLSCPAVLEHAFSQTSPRIGLSLDTAWALHSHADPVEMIGRFSDRVFLLHLKDFVFDRAGRPEDVICGLGNLDLDALTGALKEIDFSGPAIVEYEADVDNPVPALQKCLAEFKKYWPS